MDDVPPVAGGDIRECEAFQIAGRSRLHGLVRTEPYGRYRLWAENTQLEYVTWFQGPRSLTSRPLPSSKRG